jgi:hypothetical protein
MDITNNLYNLALTFFRGCIITTMVTGVYIIGVIKYAKEAEKHYLRARKIEVNNMNNEEDI